MEPPPKADPSLATLAEDGRIEGLARRLTVFDATMIVMGGIIGGGIFVNTAEVARGTQIAWLSNLAWAVGGLIALIGAFVYAELAARRPGVGGQYAYLRDAYHPLVAFLYGWTLLLVVQTGGMAAAAMIFGRYMRELSGIGTPEGVVAVLTLMMLTVINCIGVKAGSNVQSFLMIVKLMAIATLIWFGLFPRFDVSLVTQSGGGLATVSYSHIPISILIALVPIMFTYGGWQTASFVSGEMRNPTRDLPRGLIFGVIGVITVYMLVNIASLHALGVGGLAQSKAPGSDIMRLNFGAAGARFIATAIAISTVGFLSQSMLTAPRVYYAMARDGVFFKAIGQLGARSRVPVAAIALQGVTASVIALWGRFDQVLNYVVSIDVLFFGLTGAALLVFRRRAAGQSAPPIRVPFHPITTLAFVGACWAIAITTILHAPTDAGSGVAILAIGVPVYFWWTRKNRLTATSR
jgi:basic amino acid/polyamine antiporter, APA family